MYHFLTLEGAAKYYESVMNLYITYKKNLPIDIYEVKYEDIVSSIEKESKRLAVFLNIEWDSNMLNYTETAKQHNINTPSYTQVVQPIYKKAISRWRMYTKYLKPILPILQPFVEAFDYDI